MEFFNQIKHMRSYNIYNHDTTLKMAFGAIFPPILIPDPLAQSWQKQWSPYPTWWNPLKRTTKGLRNLVVWSRSVKRMMTMIHPYHLLMVWAEPLPKGHQIPQEIIPQNCTCSKVEKVTWSGLKVCSPVGQPVNVWPVLQQGLHVQDQEGKLCAEHDKQSWWFEDHQTRQAPMI